MEHGQVTKTRISLGVDEDGNEKPIRPHPAYESVRAECKYDLKPVAYITPTV
jgi:hypothetical protein